ncbi:NAD-dependent epimerase/dehydratase family protein [Paraburkholderia acidipaludis]|uniref:NAD-dependent epimerase/dehydratase family protein n=1 Tax=Paraburkholderia acidipaludis TaxID=660537 RepID=UPI000693CBF1|nr:NAD(P)-dependent oxidoreductase [Paraburkholderia acidipaludis]
MKALLTGGAGFIGRNLARQLMALGYEVVALGRRACPVAGVKSVEAVRLDPGSLRDVMAAQRFDVVFHLAAAGVHPADRNRDELVRVNTILPAEVVAAASVFGVASVVLMGSSAEYAGQTTGLLREDMPLESRKLYGATKAAGGLLALATAAECGLPVAVLRAFNVFGQGEGDHRLLPSLFAKLRQREQVNLSAGTQVRDFVYVDDACDGLIAAATALSAGAMPSGAYNLSSGVGTSVKDFACAVARCMGVDATLLRFGALPLRPDDLPMVVGDPSGLANAIGWHANYSLDEGVEAALRRFASN